MIDNTLEATKEVASADMVRYADEIAEKRPYKPDAIEEAYVAALKGEFAVDAMNDQRSFDFFQRRNKQSWMTQNQEDSYALFHLTKKDPWRSNVRGMTIPKKIDIVLGAIGDLNLQPETHSLTMFGEEAKAMGDAMDTLLEHARERDLRDRKFQTACRELLVQGTVSEHVSWRVTSTPDKVITKEYSDGRCEWRDTGTFTTDERVWSEVDPFNRVIWGDVSQMFADLQPRKWRVKVVPYGVARALLKDNPMFDYVKPTKITGNQWIDTDSQNQSEWAANAWWVVLLEYENLPRNVYGLLANGVLMTPVNRPMPGKFAHKKYSNTLCQLFPFGGFYAGDSLVRRLHNDAALLDFFTNALVDYTRQDLVPPVVVSFRNAVSRSMFAPGSITRASGDFKVQNLLQARHGFDEAMALTRFIEDNLDKMVRTEVQQQQTKDRGVQGQVTAEAIRENTREKLTALFTVFNAVATMERDMTELMSLQILDHYPDLGIGKIDSKIGKLAGIKQVFSSQGSIGGGKMGARQVAFGSVADGDASKLVSAMKDDQSTADIMGTPKKWTILSKDDIDNYQHMFYVKVNPQDRKSKKADKQEVRDNAMFLTQLMGGQAPEALLKETMTAMGYDADKMMPKQPPQMPQPQPGQPPQQPQPQPVM